MKKLLIAAVLLPTLAFADPTLQMEASARSQVANDEMVAVLSADRAGNTVGSLNDAVMTALNEAVREAKATPHVNVRMGSFSTNPNWDNGKQAGWRVHGEVVLTSPDMKALSELVGKLGQALQVANVSFRLSDKAREAEEKALLAKAAANFREKADAASKAFGFSGYQFKELTLSHSGVQPMPRPVPMMAFKASSMAAPMPAEGGDSDVSVTVSGAITLTK